MNKLTTWAEKLESLRGWFPDIVDQVPHQGTTAGEAKELADAGFAFLKDHSDLDAESVPAFWFWTQALSKFRGQADISPESRKEQAINGFLSRNLNAREHRIPWRLRKRMRELLDAALPCVDDEPGHFGPGAVSEGYDALVRWSLVPLFRVDARTQEWSGDRERWWEQCAPHSVARLCAVPKDVRRDRLITVEPGENSFWQQALRSRLLKSVHSGPLRGSIQDQIISGRAEELQRRRCLRASMDGLHASVDMSNASDSISYADVCDVFPGWVLHDADLCRSAEFRTPDGQTHPLYIYAGMGNASTFMVETLYFWALFTALSEYVGSRAHASVFGDDAIVGTRVIENPLVREMITACGIEINEVKTCTREGPGFREACGAACYRGLMLPYVYRVKGPFPSTTLGEINLCTLTTHWDWSSIYQCNLLAGEILRDRPLKVLKVDTPQTGFDVVFSRHQRNQGGVTCRWDGKYQRPYIVANAVCAEPRRYFFEDLMPGQALGVLSGALKADTCVRRHKVRTIIKIDVPKRVRIVPRKQYLLIGRVENEV